MILLRNWRGPTGVLIVLAALSGCAHGDASRPRARAVAPCPAPISHVVLIKLNDPADAPALIADSDSVIPRIAGVISYACGRPLPGDRPMVDADYHVGVYIGFEDPAAYDRYVVDQSHVDLVARWKPRMAWLRIHDVVDDSP